MTTSVAHCVEPVVLASNQPADRFYLGGDRISDFRGEPPKGTRVPEDWIASTTKVAAHADLGLTVLPSGRSLIDDIHLDPVAWLGAEHVLAYGVDTKLLVKLLHAGQRLPVHAHPTGAFAAEHLGRSHGKAEAWFILSPGHIHLGLKQDVCLSELARLVETQGTDELLELLHRRHVGAGDTVFVPPGMLHAIGADTFLVELQEPEDLSILLEWRDFELDGAADGHLGLGFPTALRAIDRSARTPDEISTLVRSSAWGPSILPPSSEQFFRLERCCVDDAIDVESGFSVLIVAHGTIALKWEGASPRELPRGRTVVIPAAARHVKISGAGEVLICRPPRVPAMETRSLHT